MHVSVSGVCACVCVSVCLRVCVFVHVSVSGVCACVCVWCVCTCACVCMCVCVFVCVCVPIHGVWTLTYNVRQEFAGLEVDSREVARCGGAVDQAAPL